jgi:hypothetical protein
MLQKTDSANPQAVCASICSPANKTFLRHELLEPKRRVRYEMLIKTKNDVHRQQSTECLYFAGLKTTEILLAGVVD